MTDVRHLKFVPPSEITTDCGWKALSDLVAFYKTKLRALGEGHDVQLFLGKRNQRHSGFAPAVGYLLNLIWLNQSLTRIFSDAVVDIQTDRRIKRALRE